MLSKPKKVKKAARAKLPPNPTDQDIIEYFADHNCSATCHRRCIMLWSPMMLMIYRKMAGLDTLCKAEKVTACATFLKRFVRRAENLFISLTH